jgi:hypothetical protein
MKEPKFKTVDGYLTGHALSCGYFERWVFGDKELQLTKDGDYQVVLYGVGGRRIFERYGIRKISVARYVYSGCRKDVISGIMC